MAKEASGSSEPAVQYYNRQRQQRKNTNQCNNNIFHEVSAEVSEHIAEALWVLFQAAKSRSGTNFMYAMQITFHGLSLSSSVLKVTLLLTSSFLL